MEAFNKIARGGDYIKDGLLYCGKCHTQKQVRVDPFGTGEQIKFCLCKCAKAKRDAEDEEWEKKKALREVQDLRAYGIPEAEMQQWTFERDDKANPKLTRWARNYVAAFPSTLEKGLGIVLYGPVGTGKTFAAACVANALIDQGRPVLMTSFSRIKNILQAERNRQDYLDSFAKYELIVIDDLGAENDTGFMEEIVYAVIDARYRQHRPLIVTTNYTRDEINHAEDTAKKRIFSRLFEMCTFMEVEGKDRRRAINKKNREEMERMVEDD